MDHYLERADSPDIVPISHITPVVGTAIIFSLISSASHTPGHDCTILLVILLMVVRTILLVILVMIVQYFCLSWSWLYVQYFWLFWSWLYNTSGFPGDKCTATQSWQKLDKFVNQMFGTNYSHSVQFVKKGLGWSPITLCTLYEVYILVAAVLLSCAMIVMMHSVQTSSQSFRHSNWILELALVLLL